MALISNVQLMGSSLSNNFVTQLKSAKVTGSNTEVTELDMELIDPDWKVLGSGVLQLGMSIVVDKFNLEIAVLETGADNSQETVTIKARPLIVRRIKNRQGKFVMNNISPTEYLQKICREVGAPLVAQPSARIPSIARDFTPSGRQELRQPKNDWTTMVRLARSVGFFFFESAGTIFFGQPSWLIENVPSRLNIAYNKRDPNTPITMVPECSRSEDAPEITVRTQVRVANATSVFAGMRMDLSGVPIFSGAYITDRIEIDLLDPKQLCDVNGTNPVNPEVQA